MSELSIEEGTNIVHRMRSCISHSSDLRKFQRRGRRHVYYQHGFCSPLAETIHFLSFCFGEKKIIRLFLEERMVMIGNRHLLYVV
jgi:hypothetical protein